MSLPASHRSSQGVCALLGLLGSISLDSATEIASDVRHIVSLGSETLKRLPTLSHSRRCALMGHSRIDTGCSVRDRSLNKGALGVSGAKKCRIDDQENPAALRKRESSEDNTGKESDLKSSNHGHARVVVCLDESTDTLGKWGLFCGRAGGRGWGRWGSWLSWLQGWDQVGSRIGSHMENRVDAEWQKSQRDLAGKQPDKCHP